MLNIAGTGTQYPMTSIAPRSAAIQITTSNAQQRAPEGRTAMSDVLRRAGGILLPLPLFTYLLGQTFRRRRKNQNLRPVHHICTPLSRMATRLLVALLLGTSASWRTASQELPAGDLCALGIAGLSDRIAMYHQLAAVVNRTNSTHSLHSREALRRFQIRATWTRRGKRLQKAVE